MEIGIISEGESDQIVIEAIIQKTFNNKDIILDQLQPKPREAGGWPLVIKYCQSDEFKAAFAYNELVIIHIDADVLKGADIPTNLRVNLNGLSVNETFYKIKELLISIIGSFYESQKDNIIFAIAIDQIECWFLPIYFPTKKAACNKVSGAIKTLNTVLMKEEGFYLDAKNREYFEKMSKRFFVKGAIEHCSRTNNSFNLFHEQLVPFLNKNQPPPLVEI